MIQVVEHLPSKGSGFKLLYCREGEEEAVKTKQKVMPSLRSYDFAGASTMQIAILHCKCRVA
jgi:hypothetical protein